MTARWAATVENAGAYGKPGEGRISRMNKHDKPVATLLFAGLLSGATLAAPPAAPKAQDIRFAPGTSAAELKGTVKGYASADYRLVAGTGQTLSVEMKRTNGAQYFNIVSPGSNEAMFIGETTGVQAKVVLPTDGAYLIRTYLMRSAARRNESSRYTMNVAVTGQALAALPASQDAKVAGTRFHATTELSCKPPYGAAPTRCEAGVVRRGRDGTATVEIRGPNQLLRQILFVKGEPVASNSAQALASRRSGDTTTVEIGGDERFDVPDALLTGG
jgi:hypothetical protein